MTSSRSAEVGGAAEEAEEAAEEEAGAAAEEGTGATAGVNGAHQRADIVLGAAHRALMIAALPALAALAFTILPCALPASDAPPPKTWCVPHDSLPHELA